MGQGNTDGIVDFLQSLLVRIAFGSHNMQQLFYSREQLFSDFYDSRYPDG